MADYNVGSVDHPSNISRFLGIIRGTPVVEEQAAGAMPAAEPQTTTEPDSTIAREWTSTQKALVARKMEMAKHADSYMDHVVANFRKANQGILIQGKGARTVGIAITSPAKPEPSDVEPSTGYNGSQLSNALEGVSIADETSSLRAHDHNSTAENPSSESDDEPSSRHSSDRVDQNVESEDAGSAALLATNQANAFPFKITQSPTIVVTASTETQESSADSVSDGDRQHQTHFKSWGTPTARNKQKSFVRTVTLTNLPSTADYALVQSLIHGGSIETMKIVPSTSTASNCIAMVTFTTAKAFDEYYALYPNGIDIRHQGKRQTVFVGKQERVDVMSSVMQGYLECGATRVVKVTGAEDDWGIVALHKLAEGKKQTRQLECIIDTFRSGTRTIFFRFANIADAVKFKGFLMHDAD